MSQCGLGTAAFEWEASHSKRALAFPHEQLTNPLGYRKAKFHSIAIFETRFALLYIAIASISVLPAHLPR